MSQDPRWTCPGCGGTFRQRPYDIGSGPEISCPHCEWCWGAAGQDLKPLDAEALLAEIRPPGAVVGVLVFDPLQDPTEGEGA